MYQSRFIRVSSWQKRIYIFVETSRDFIIAMHISFAIIKSRRVGNVYCVVVYYGNVVWCGNIVWYGVVWRVMVSGKVGMVRYDII